MKRIGFTGNASAASSELLCNVSTASAQSAAYDFSTWCFIVELLGDGTTRNYGFKYCALNRYAIDCPNEIYRKYLFLFIILCFQKVPNLRSEARSKLQSKALT